MQKYVFVYHGGPKSMSPEEGKEYMGKWLDWMSSLGEAVVDRGLVVGKSVTVGQSGISLDGGANPVSGYTVVKTESLDSATELATKCPHIAIGGSIEIAPALNIPM
ncbi:YciI family protein [Gimibacter soli]|uniref:YCII-related domain-containing protein n=1 Tax=Gimibacter soli TaxID=3024400 RepID=A0AAE9XM51_9PROT|nr:hypothetical protein [Gimibacter soli]WCL53472.1 hypothetical protein PH603_13080 [Gimibacter soli]